MSFKTKEWKEKLKAVIQQNGDKNAALQEVMDELVAVARAKPKPYSELYEEEAWSLSHYLYISAQIELLHEDPPQVTKDEVLREVTETVQKMSEYHEMK